MEPHERALSSSTPIVTISVRNGQKFYVHETILTQNSTYFDRALRGQFLEGSTQSIVFDDISAEDFGEYVNVLYQAVLTEKVILYDGGDLDRPFYTSKRLINFLRMWQLADRFLDSKMTAIVEDTIDFRFSLLSVSKWEVYYEQNLSRMPEIGVRFKLLQDAFHFCNKESIPYQEQVVTALANCPPQVFAEHVQHLDEDFKTAVTRAFALRFVDFHDSKVAKIQTPKKTVTPKKRKLW